VHGLEGLIVGLWANRDSNHWWVRIMAMTLGTLVMVGGYFLSDMMLYNTAAGIIGIPMNIIQGVIGMVVTVLIYPMIKRRI